MLRPMPYALALYILGVALGRGGYAPWASLLFQAGAAGLLLWTVAGIVWETSARERERNRELSRAWRRLPLRTRHRAIGLALRILTLGRFRGATDLDVEILLPGSERKARDGRSRASTSYILGYPFRRTHLGVPLLLLTLWIGLSVTPVSKGWLDDLSPQALSLRAEAESLSGRQADTSPWSLAPFLTWRSLWLWLACMALFYVSVHLSENPIRVERLSRLLLFILIAFGVYGIGQWLFGLRGLMGAEPSTAGLRATGTFGNRNHYAAFMEMLLLCSLGWIGYRWARVSAPGRRPSWGGNLFTQEAKAGLLVAALGIVISSLGLIFSLSRSGISFALVGCAIFALLATPVHEGHASHTVDLERSWRGGPRATGNRRGMPRVYWALALATLAFAFWIGIGPLLTRFEMLPEHWDAENGRVQVWVDSLAAVKDYWLTGSGLSSFRYVYPVYRSYGGTLFYSWAHNDYLQALVELGVPGLVLISWIMGALYQGARRVRRELLEDPPLLHLHAGYAAAAIAIAFHSFTDFGLHMAANAALLCVILGVVVGLGKPQNPWNRHESCR